MKFFFNLFHFFSFNLLFGQLKHNFGIVSSTHNQNRSNLMSETLNMAYGIDYTVIHKSGLQLSTQYLISNSNIEALNTNKHFAFLFLGYKNRFITPKIGIGSVYETSDFAFSRNDVLLSLSFSKRFFYTEVFITTPRVYNFTFGDIQALDNILCGINIPLNQENRNTNKELDLILSFGGNFSKNSNHKQREQFQKSLLFSLSYGLEVKSKTTDWSIGYQRLSGLSQHDVSTGAEYNFVKNYFELSKYYSHKNHDFRLGISYLYGYDYAQYSLNPSLNSRWGNPNMKGLSLRISYILKDNIELSLRNDVLTQSMNRDILGFAFENLNLGINYRIQ